MTHFKFDSPFCTYMIYDRVDNILVYIGYTSDFYRRKYQHFNSKITTHPINRYIRSFIDYRTRFEISYLSRYPTKSDAISDELYLIKTLNPICNIYHSNQCKRHDLS